MALQYNYINNRTKAAYVISKALSFGNAKFRIRSARKITTGVTAVRASNLQLSKCYNYITPSAGLRLLSVSFVASLKPNLCTGLTTKNTTTNDCIFSHAQNTTALQPNVFPNGMHRLLGHK